MDLKKLADIYPSKDIHWRAAQCDDKSGKAKAKLLAYIDARHVQDRLDDAVGPENWKTSYHNITIQTKTGMITAVMCELSIKCGDEWVTKTDGAEATDIEATKGNISDAFKRAAVHWGIGRYLYGLDSPWAKDVKEGWAPDGSGRIQLSAKSSKKKYHCACPDIDKLMDAKKAPPKNDRPRAESGRALSQGIKTRKITIAKCQDKKQEKGPYKFKTESGNIAISWSKTVFDVASENIGTELKMSYSTKGDDITIEKLEPCA